MYKIIINICELVCDIHAICDVYSIIWEVELQISRVLYAKKVQLV